jgi:signal transduction histidine kinase
MTNELREEQHALKECPDAGTRPESGLDSAKMMLLFNAAKALASTTNIDQLLDVIVSEVQMVLNCEGAGVLLYDAERDDFYWRNVQDRESFFASAREEIRIPKDQGVCGWVFRTGEPALVHDAVTDPRIYRPVEDKSGFMTRNMVCVPLQVLDKRLGVLYALNKDGSFTDSDVDIMTALSGNVALALENAANFESLMNSNKELERLNRVKNKILHHLSHELKTPLAIVEASLRIMQNRLEDEGVDVGKLPFGRISRSLTRLKTIEKQVAHIVEDKIYLEREAILSFLDNLPDLIEVQQEQEPLVGQALEFLKQKIEEQFPDKIQETEGITVHSAFQAVESRLRQMLEERQLDIRFLEPDRATIRIQPHIMMSVLGGLIRNAVENTPDHGRIIISGENVPSGYRITIRDYGVGIPESEQPNIFEGFYPVQETDLYSSGRKYEFNAGGTGTDLLKIKIFSARFGFKVGFHSLRCPHLPTTRDICPGSVLRCPHCSSVEDCIEKGGTEFFIDIPSQLIENEQTSA